MRRSSREGPCQEETGWPLVKMVVDVVDVVVAVDDVKAKTVDFLQILQNGRT